MKILVIGSSGQLARSLTERAPGWAGLELVALGRPDLNLEAPGSAGAAIRKVAPNVVINAAAYTDVDGAEDEPERAFQINAHGAGEVAEATSALGIPLIQLSTDYVFDGSAAGAYAEDARPSPLGAYARSKLAGEEQVRAAHPAGVIVRSASVYSSYGRNFVKSMFDAADHRDELRVVADQRGSPTSALDLADALLTMIGHWSEGRRTGQGETFNVAGSGDASWYELAVEVMGARARLGLRTATVEPIATYEWPTKAERPRNSVLDSRKFERDFGFRMPDWRKSVADVVNRLAAER